MGGFLLAGRSSTPRKPPHRIYPCGKADKTRNSVTEVTLFHETLKAFLSTAPPGFRRVLFY